MSFRPLYPRDRIWAGLLALILAILALLALYGLLTRPIGPGSVILGWISLLLAGISALLLYRLWSLHTLDYWVQRDAIHIHWHGEEVIIPLPHIQTIEPAQVTLRPAWGHWPEPWIQWDENQRILAYATQPPSASLAIITQDETYLISLQDPDAFIAAYQERRNFGPARHLRPVIYLAPWRQHWLLQDRWAQILLGGGLLLGLLLLSYVAWHYPSLPPTIALHFDTQGNPDLLSPRRSIFLLPAFTLLMGFLNAAIGYTLYTYRRFIAYFLWSASVILQLLGFYLIHRLI